VSIRLLILGSVSGRTRRSWQLPDYWVS